MEKTKRQYFQVIQDCKQLFEKKLHDYGAAWRILRPESLTDQIFIKANRIRTIQQTQNKKIQEDETAEFMGIVNYSVIYLIQLELGVASQPDLNPEECLVLFDEKVKAAYDLMAEKNHDYGEAWREMRISSMTDLILQKLFRIKQIEDNKGQTLISEGLEANVFDILNYAVFCLILISEKKSVAI